MKKVVVVLMITAFCIGAFTHLSFAAKGHNVVEFYKVTQDYPTNGIQRFRILGQGCLSAEDVTKLRLVNYDPADHKVVYRCVQP